MRNLLIPFGIKPKVRIENPYGDMYARSLAAGIDLLFLFVILYDYFFWMDQRYFPMIGADFIENFSSAAPPQRAQLITQWMARSMVQVFFFGVVIVGCQSIFATTPGKWIMGLKIVRAKTHGRVSAWRFLLRFIAYIPACAPLMLGMIWMGFNSERRGWHDYIAGTAVLNMRPDGWYWKQLKRGFIYVRARISSLAVEQAMREPAAEKRHGDGDKPVE